eukprot:CAMPEP_0202085358 /NCGR_PEP_ID=MMETSP0964-20121228/30508_1 /ASSEMBLY_ACC=CAM_ASM_000500 /TAXON_ID=4773 /ORGANISM="Schizochytrium aggregatum, Strain ATCC28209" /LENGTH=61 /DNA_ID=CAMNT_0048653187 /DNA_START=36 /DNA_END=221 /DNA_ORIENTATION=+
MAAVKARGTNKELLGSALSLTPVRRSARLSGATPQEDRAELLRRANYSFAPNPCIDEEELL